MSLKVTVEEMRQLLRTVIDDLAKATSGNKAASQRVRVTTVDLEKAAKKYRKESIGAERSSKGKSPKKAKAAGKSSAKVIRKPSAKLMAKPSAKLAKKPTAKHVKKPIAKPAKKPIAHKVKKPIAKLAKKPIVKAVIGKAKSIKSTVLTAKRPTAKLPRKR